MLHPRRRGPKHSELEFDATQAPHKLTL